MCGGLMPLAAELDEDRDLLADDLRIERLDEIVGAPGCVRPVNLFRVLTEGGDEDDGNVAAALERLEMSRNLETVHPGHRHVDQRHGEAVAEGEAERFLTRGRGDDAIVGPIEDGRERGE